MAEDNGIWATALGEAEDPGKRDAGLWARCFAESGGDDAKAKAAYVKAKVELSKPAPIMGFCPNCNYELSLQADACPNCKALFDGTDWRPTLTKQGTNFNMQGAEPYSADRAARASGAPVQLVKSAKSRGIYIILGLFFGCFGIHNFYAGRLGVGVAQFLITAIAGWFVIGFVITGIWAIIEMFTVKVDGSGDAMA